MTCTGCENNIQFALTSLDGVDSVDADHRAESVRVDYDPEVISPAEIRRAIEDMGYRLDET
jgi:copper chaperone CopZ